MNQKRKLIENHQINFQTQKKLKLQDEKGFDTQEDEDLSVENSQQDQNEYQDSILQSDQKPSKKNGQMGSANKNKQRHDNSLSVLTKKFVKLIKESPQNQIDLNDTVKELDVQKRRIYDITNVLEGIGYIEKTHKNKIKWVGGSSDPQLEEEIMQMQKELKQYEQEEQELDYWIDHLHKGLSETFLNNQEQSQYTYLTYEDFKQLGKLASEENGEALFIITAPKGTTMEVPVINSEQTQEYPHQLFLNSKNGEIQIYLCSDENYPMVSEKPNTKQKGLKE